MDVVAISKNIHTYAASHISAAACVCKELWLGAYEVTLLRKTHTTEKISTILHTRMWQLENQPGSQKKIGIIKFQLCLNAIMSLPSKIMRIFCAAIMTQNEKSTFINTLKQHASNTLASPSLDEGRKKILEEIQTYPEALLLDIVRGFDVLLVGNERFEKVLYNKTAQECHDILEGAIRRLVHETTPSLKPTDGDFHEVIYLLVQNFCSTPSAKLATDPNLPPCLWPPISDKTTRSVSYTMEDNTTLLYKTTITKEHYNLSNQTEPHKTSATTTECRYNLQTHQVDFTFHYTLDSNTLTWHQKDPFATTF